jgi:hypothetical protein
LTKEFFSLKNIFKRKSPEQLTEHLINKYFNPQKVLNITDFLLFEKEGRMKELTSFQKILFKIQDPNVFKSKALEKILTLFPEYLAETLFQNYYSPRHSGSSCDILTYEDCNGVREMFINSQLEGSLVKQAT